MNDQFHEPPIPYDVERRETLRLVRLLCRFIFALVSLWTVCGGIAIGAALGGVLGFFIGACVSSGLTVLLFFNLRSYDEQNLQDVAESMP